MTRWRLYGYRRVVRLAGSIFVLLSGCVLLFQVALLFGAPLGMHTQGGRAQTEAGRLVGTSRRVSALAIPLLVFFSLVVAAKAELSGWFADQPWVTVATWVVVGMVLLNLVGNLLSTSNVERYLFGLIAAVQAVAAFVVALS